MSKVATVKIQRAKSISKFIMISALIGFLSAFLALSLKHLTEHYER